METRKLAGGSIDVSVVCIGTSALGSKPETYGYEVDETTAVATVQQALQTPIRFLDTANEYSGGESERRVGQAIRAVGGVPEGFTVATKADPARGDTAFTGARVHESFRESTERLGGVRFGVYYLHDPERFDFHRTAGPGGAVEAMVELKRSGLVDAIGVAGGDLEQLRRYVDTGVFDVLLNHNRYTLLDRPADALIDHAVEAGVSFVNAAPYASGILAKPAAARAPYQYRTPDADVLATTDRLREVCRAYRVPLAAVALQFSTRDPRISSTVVGVSAPQRVNELVANESALIPEELWGEVHAILGIDARDLPADESRLRREPPEA